jgi:hypothetical protein
MNDFIEDHGLTLAAAVVAILGLATQVPSLQAKYQADQVKSQISSTQSATNDRLTLEAMKRKDRQTIANSRYESGCEVVAEIKTPNVAATLQEGNPIVVGSKAQEYMQLRSKGVSAQSLIPYYWNTEQVFCDFYGVSAVTRFDPAKGYFVATDIATTTDQAYIQKARNKFPSVFKPNTAKGN